MKRVTIKNYSKDSTEYVKKKLELSYKENKEEEAEITTIYYRDEKNLTCFYYNNFDIIAEEAALYIESWQIELLFKKINKDFQLHYFYGEMKNASELKSGLLIGSMLLTYYKKCYVKKAFSTIATLVRTSYKLLDVYELLGNVKRVYAKKKQTELHQVISWWIRMGVF